MKRRGAIKNLSLAIAGLATLPAWASSWNLNSLGTIPAMALPEENLLAELVETIIPETDTPGAKSLQVHQFVLRMVQDCLGEPAQTQFKEGFKTVEQVANGAFGKSFIHLDPTQRTSVLTHLQQGEDLSARQFIQTIKHLTIQGYLNSEYVLVNLLHYTMAPGFYHGCVPVKS